MHKKPAPRSRPVKHWLLPAALLATLAACGGGADPQSGVDTTPSAPLASGSTTLELEPAVMPESAAQLIAQPSFHAAPVILDEPSDADSGGNSATASMAPREQSVPVEFEELPTRGLTLQTLDAARRLQALGNRGSAQPLAGTGVIATYTPAQIRAAYGLPALPAAGTVLTAEQAAQLGAGQTIYIVDAKHDPNVVAELAAFNQKFGLPGCTTKVIATTASLPLAPASASACEFSVVYSTPAGGRTATAPGYDAGWATEIALDVQWAHATAPLARIVLIESADATLDSLLGGVKLANAMGPGVVSMSFGANEGSYTASVDAAFAAPNMSYLAATGDSGAAVSWPAVSTRVLAVGGTTLSYTGSGSRSEVAWSGTGGGISAYTSTPGYQTSGLPGMGSTARRTVADVAMNADPSSGQYTAVIAQGSSTVQWSSIGGTSLATPQWAGLVAVANAMRARTAKAALGAPHAMLYGQVGAVPGTYAIAFTDIVKGSHGTCGSCSTRTGYDQLTGLGTPNAASLLSTLSGIAAAPVAPVVTSAAIGGDAGVALSFTANVSAVNPVACTLSGAPSGMVAAVGSCAISWPAPVAGSYAVTIAAKDSKTGLSGQGLYTVTIVAAKAPVLTAAIVNGTVGKALSYTVGVTAAHSVVYTLLNAPSGLTINSAGVLAWAAPVVGNYNVNVVAKDSFNGLTGQAVFNVKISAQAAPTVAGGSITGKVGTALSFAVAATAPNAVSYSLSGAPAGMAIGAAGLVTWASPVAGSYSVTAIAKDSKTGLSGQAVYSVKIAAATTGTASGPTITAAPITGVAGKALSASIVITAPGATSVSVSITGTPMGMSFSANGLTLTAAWAKPVTGSYNMKITVSDSTGKSATANVPITISAK